MEQRIFTTEQLQQFDGKEGRPVYLAYKGKVYDVSASDLWQGGSHWDEHTAGKELTGEMGNAPHEPSVLNKFPIVGDLAV